MSNYKKHYQVLLESLTYEQFKQILEESDTLQTMLLDYINSNVVVE